MRHAAVALALAALASIPAAQACSLAYRPFDQAQWVDGDLHFVDGDRLRRVTGAVESTVADGYFLSYAPVDGGLLVAGQDGLGADCSGTSWLRLYHGSAVAWEDDVAARVVPHRDGPLVLLGRELHRFAGGRLEDTGHRLPAGAWMVGVTHDARLVYVDGGSLVVGERASPYSSGALVSAHDAGAGLTAVLRSGDDGKATMAFHLADGTVTTTAWAAPWGQVGLTPADGWVALAGGRAYRVGATPVTDLGVAAVAVGARGDLAAVFQESGYTVFEDGRPVEAWARDGLPGEARTWRPLPPPAAQSSSVAASTSEGPAGSRVPDGAAGGPDGGGRGLPAVPAPAAVLALAALAAAARRGRA